MDRWPLHPLLLAAFPVLFLWSQNVGEVRPDDAIPILGVVVAATLGLLVLAAALLRDLRKGALIASLAAALVLSYGHVWADARPVVGLAIWGLLLVVGAVAVARMAEVSDGMATRFANALGIVLVATTLIPLAGEAAADDGPARAPVDVEGVEGPPRDVFYIILDRYPREDSARDVFGYDNSAFTAFLGSHGFDVAEASLANYPKTAHSLAASLNLEYLDQLEQGGYQGDDWGPVYRMLREHEVGETLTSLGYDYLHLGSWWSPTATADSATETMTYDATSEFSQVFRLTTAFPAVASLLGVEDAELTSRELKRAHTAYQFDVLDDLVREEPERPRFVLAHLTIPHEPYVFAADGSWIPPELEASRSRTENFIPQLEYANARMRAIVEALDERSDDPIVVIQADEGPHPEERVRQGPAYSWVQAPLHELREKLEILNAYRLPGVSDEEIPEDITPVNTFRLIFNRYFGADLELLPDRTYVFPDESQLYTYLDITGRVRR